MLKTEELKLVSEWDKTFPQSEKVDHKKVTFVNRYGITLAADLYKPKNVSGKYPAIAVSGPFGAIKEQCSGLYAQTMAEKGYLTIAFDPSFTGESGGNPRFMASPDINTEDFMAAVDFLSVREDVDTDKIGIIGICGWGGMALNATALDTRIKATVASTMYDMTRVIGAVELKLNGHTDMTDRDDECELGYWLGEPFWGRGYMPEAAYALMKRGFETLEMTTIWCGYYDGNKKSKRVQEKLGFIYHHTCDEVPVPLLNEVRVGHTNVITKEQWKSHTQPDGKIHVANIEEV